MSDTDRVALEVSGGECHGTITATGVTQAVADDLVILMARHGFPVHPSSVEKARTR